MVNNAREFLRMLEDRFKALMNNPKGISGLWDFSKAKARFLETVWGKGTGTGDNGKGYITKDTDGMHLKYITSTGKTQVIHNTDDGMTVEGAPELGTSIRNVIIGTTSPSEDIGNPGDTYWMIGAGQTTTYTTTTGGGHNHTASTSNTTVTYSWSESLATELLQNHGIPADTWLAIVDSNLNVVSRVQWKPSGLVINSHSHTVTVDAAIGHSHDVEA